MNQRAALRGDLKAAWKSVIQCKYDKQQIDSEASLQVHFAAALLDRFKCESRTRRIFVEPTIQIESPRIYKKPDLLICNRQSIIGIIEIKFVPRGRARYQKDLETLDLLIENRLKFAIANERYLGPHKVTKRYSLAQDAVLCWAAVYSGSLIDNPAFRSAEERQDFLALHALTSDQSVAEIHPQSRNNVIPSLSDTGISCRKPPFV